MSTITITKHSEAYWRVTFDIPPLNVFRAGEHCLSLRRSFAQSKMMASSGWLSWTVRLRDSF